jgi:hypothetical protein
MYVTIGKFLIFTISSTIKFEAQMTEKIKAMIQKILKLLQKLLKIFLRKKL